MPPRFSHDRPPPERTHKKEHKLANHARPDRHVVTKKELLTHKSNKGILEKLLENDNARLNLNGNETESAVPQVKMSNGRTANIGTGQWKRKDGKWVLEMDEGPKSIDARLVDKRRDRDQSLNSQGHEHSPGRKSRGKNETYC